MTTQGNSPVNDNEPKLENLSSPSSLRGPSVEEQLMTALKEISVLRMKCYGDQTIKDKVFYDIVRPGKGNSTVLLLEGDRAIPLGTFLRKLIDEGQVIDVSVQAEVQPRGCSNRRVEVSKHCKITKGDIPKIDQAFRTSEWRAGYDSYGSPSIVISYHE